MSKALYNREILRLAVSIPHQGRLAKPDFSKEVRSKTCGSRVIADLILTEDGKIEELGLEVQACALGQAAAAIVGGEAIGRSMEEFAAARDTMARFLSGQSNSPGEWKNLDQLSVAKDHGGRHAAILLPFDAVLAAFSSASGNPSDQQERVQ